MTVLCLILGTAYIAQMWGLSLAMGAFLAGVVISESEYVHEIAAQIFPFRDVFNGVFFISIGMLLDLPFLARNLPTVLLLSLAVVLGKTFCTGAAIRALRYPWRTTVVAAVGLGHVGEFAFLLLSQGFREGLVGPESYQNLLAIAILSMVVTPFLIDAAPDIGRLWVRYVARGPIEPAVGEDPAHPEQRMENHVIIAGYGMNGRNLARVLRATRLPYVVVDLNDVLVRERRAAGEPMFYGDVNNPDFLERVGISRARMLVLAISDPMATRRAVAVARRTQPGLFILVRTRYVSDVDDLIALGASAVIPEEFETSVEIFSRVLREYHVPENVIRQQEELIRGGTYRILRERVIPRGEEMLDEFEEFLRWKVIEVFYVAPGSGWAGRTGRGAAGLRGRGDRPAGRAPRGPGHRPAAPGGTAGGGGQAGPLRRARPPGGGHLGAGEAAPLAGSPIPSLKW